MDSVTRSRSLRRVVLNAVAVFAALKPLVAFAHPGHPSAYPPYSVAHYLTSPVHLTALGAVVAIGVMGIVRWSRGQSRHERDRSDDTRP